MEDYLITFGCSFTYGEALAHELIKSKYPNKFNELISVPYSKISRKMFKIGEMFKEMDDYRKNNNYSFFLKKRLNVGLISNAENGGRNIQRLMDLDILINFLESGNVGRPKYLVFQFTHIGRDIEHMLIQWDPTKEFLYETYGNDFIKKVINASNGKNDAWVLDNLFDEATRIFLMQLEKRFKKLEKLFGTKCLFFFGLGSVKSISENYYYYKNNPFFMEIKKDDKIGRAHV